MLTASQLDAFRLLAAGGELREGAEDVLHALCRAGLVVRDESGYRTLNEAEIAEARAWIADCEWADAVDVEALSPVQVVAGVARYYEGGLRAFIDATAVAA